MTIDEVAREIGVSKKTLSNRVYAKQVPVTRLVIGGLRIHRMVAHAIRIGLTGDELQHVAILCQRHRDEAELSRAVAAYIGERTEDVRGRRVARKDDATSPRGAA